MTRNQIEVLNDMAWVDWEKAKAMLEGINLVLGTKYEWLNKRVVTVESNGSCRDAWVLAWSKEE